MLAATTPAGASQARFPDDLGVTKAPRTFPTSPPTPRSCQIADPSLGIPPGARALSDPLPCRFCLPPVSPSLIGVRMLEGDGVTSSRCINAAGRRSPAVLRLPPSGSSPAPDNALAEGAVRLSKAAPPGMESGSGSAAGRRGRAHGLQAGSPTCKIVGGLGLFGPGP